MNLDDKKLLKNPHARVSGYELYRDGQHPEVVTTKANRDLVTRPIEEFFANFVSRRRIFPAQTPIFGGRSVYAHSTKEGLKTLKIPGIKMKGEIGLPLDDPGSLLLSLPRPEARYSDFLEPHLAFDSSLSPRIILGREKALFTLEESNALREFECHERLAGLNLSSRPLQSVKVEKDGMPLRDRTGAQRGSIFLEHDPALKHLGFLHFDTITREPLNFMSNELTVHTRNGGNDFHSAARTLLGAHMLIGSIKRKAAQEGRLARHVGHLDNIVGTADLSRLFLSDLDSSVLLDAHVKEKSLWGPMIFRDIASDCLRLSSAFTRSSFFGHFINQLASENVSYSPFKFFLAGTFRADNDRDLILRIDRTLCKQYARFVLTNLDLLMESAIPHADALRRQEPEPKVSRIFWSIVHFKFYPHILKAVHTLYMASSLQKDPDTALPIIEDASLERNFEQAGRLIHKAWIDASEVYAKISDQARAFEPITFE